MLTCDHHLFAVANLLVRYVVRQNNLVVQSCYVLYSSLQCNHTVITQTHCKIGILSLTVQQQIHQQSFVTLFIVLNKMNKMMMTK